MTLAAVGTAFAVGSKIVGGLADFNASRYRAAVADRNAKFAEANAVSATQRSQVEQMEQDQVASVLMGEQQAVQGASGLSIGSRSFALTRKGTGDLARRDALRIRQQGDLEARNYRQEGADYSAGAKLERQGAIMGLIGTGFDVGATLVSGASKTGKTKAAKGDFKSLVGARKG